MVFPRSICITVFLAATLLATSMAHDHEHHHGRFTESERRRPACGFREPSVKQIEEMRQEEELLERHDAERSRFLLSGRFRTFLRAFFCRVFPRLKLCDAGTIPVYMFNPHRADFTGFVPLQTIQKMVATANKDFEGTGFEFELMEYTSFVNQEYFDASAFSDAEIDLFRNHRVQDEQIISVFVKRAIIDGNVACGYAGLARTARSAPDIDAITIDYRCADDDLVLSHEIGHWLNLLHTFSGSCIIGDLVHDTPFEKEPYGRSMSDFCPTDLNTCPLRRGNDNPNNMMTYSPTGCGKEFSKGQIRRMRKAWNWYRR